MIKELTPQEVIYNLNFTEVITREEKDCSVEYIDVCESVEQALNIRNPGFNVYLVDSFSKEKLNKIVSHVESILKKKNKPKDICYVTLDDIRMPKVLFLSNGIGQVLKNRLDAVKNFYYDKTFLFYNSSTNKEKEDIINDIQRKRSDYIGGLIKAAKEEGFDLKATSSGFAFIPLLDGEAITEDEFDELEDDSKGDISIKAGKLKEGAEGVLNKLKDMELNSIEKLKSILRDYLKEESKYIREDMEEEFKDEEKAIKYLNDVCDSIEKALITNYTMNFEDDEDGIEEVISKYVINIIIDNKEHSYPRVIFEEDPTMSNLMGTIEYENHNGTYLTDVSLIKGGSILEANEGCLILRLNSLLNNDGSYYYLRRALLNNKISYDFNRGYLEILSLNGLNPQPIPIDVKVILIGDSESFDVLYNYDEDFKSIFKIKAEFSPYVDINDFTKYSLVENINKIAKENKLLNLEKDVINEIGKFLSRKASDKNKLYWDITEVEKILLLANDLALSKNNINITKNELYEVVYKMSKFEVDYLEMYKNKKILIETNEKIIGSINGLSVIDLGYLSFGKPLRITCVCYKGSGRIIDVQRESNLSGNIHQKSISILKGFLSNFLNIYSTIPVDFHLSFEQIYGRLEGDSASVAEVIAMLSALSKIPSKQNIAITGSINQFGQIQPIGGVTEKVEGFFNVCKTVDSYKGKGVLIPESNKDELILNSEVESAIEKGEFKIYTMKEINDAIILLLGGEDLSFEDIATKISCELNKFRD
ncbi:AAA family ATPase [Clostridium tarantellae]|uniref:endopeptidase La n=1 Tax=Clostridium tarantellae TaxID=39493 RepID=A0A6I1MIP3_9CLOT|nr:AAA family ATPase [Clostridium tarantellae]MPQ42268.1 AAA family ATPase [Clostridium tarantellae]